MTRILRFALQIVTLFTLGFSLLRAQEPPAAWVDKDTGHRVIRLSSEAGSSGFYFNVNAFSPDGRLMAYNGPDGIHVLDLATRKTRLLVANPPASAANNGSPAGRNGVHAIVVGHRTNSVFFARTDPATRISALYKANMDTGEVAKLTDLPPRVSVASVNADETLGAGTYTETEADAAKEFGRNTQRAAPAAPEAPRQSGNLVQAEDKQQMMERRLAARIPVVLFKIDLRTGKVTPLLHSTDWIGHMLFSPSDPALLMYCHEGPWHKVDRIWMIHADGTGNVLIHKRTMAMEIAGHEFWGLDGQTIWYDWQYPKGQDFFLAGYDLQTRKRTAFHMLRNEWSIHFNLTAGETLFAGDGGDSGQVARTPDGGFIELFHPEMLKVTGLDQPGFWQPGAFHSEHLVNMAHHNYRLEPNVRFSPDRKLVIFTSNMFGPSYVFGVEVDKSSGAKPADIQSTPQLAKRFNPTDPTPTPDDK